jgi:hypothetical protein
MKELHRFVFDMYALSFPRGRGFGEEPPIRAWRNEDGSSCGIVTKDHRDGSFGFLVMRRRTDAVWETTHSEQGLASKEDAYTSMESHAKDCYRVAIPPGTSARPSLAEVEDRSPSEVFMMLARKTHHLAAWTLNQLYLALPRPDRNWVSDCQTKGFHTRLTSIPAGCPLRSSLANCTRPSQIKRDRSVSFGRPMAAAIVWNMSRWPCRRSATACRSSVSRCFAFTRRASGDSSGPYGLIFASGPVLM